MIREALIWQLTLTTVVLCGCSNDLSWSAVDRMIASQFPAVNYVSTDSLAAQLAGSSAPILLDVRTEEEFAVSRLPGAIRVDPARRDLGGLDSLQEREIVTYCSVGFRSAEFADRLQKSGFRKVRNLRGSIFRWANEGRPVYRDGGAVREVHPYDALWATLLEEELRAYEPRRD